MKRATVIFAITGLTGLLLSASASDAGVIPFGWILCGVLFSLGCLLASYILRRKAGRGSLMRIPDDRRGRVVVFIPDDQTADLPDAACR